MVVAISGKPGSGKTTVCNNLSNTGDYIFLELGIIFRSILCYLKENKLDNILTLDKLDDLKLMDNINITYDVNNSNKLIIFINNKCYKYDELFNKGMNMETVKLGGLIGDNLNYKIRPLIFDLSSKNDVILNVRKPFTMYPELDLHIFLTASFDIRSFRKSLLNDITLEEAKKLLLERDLMEERNGFFQVSPKSKIIDTSNINSEETYKRVKRLIKDMR